MVSNKIKLKVASFEPCVSRSSMLMKVRKRSTINHLNTSPATLTSP